MIDIITPTFNNEKYTVKCFESIRKNTTKDYRIIWVDNGSTKESRKKVMKEIVKHKNYLTIWLTTNTGFITASNLGLNASTSKKVVLLNNDTEVIPKWLTIMESYFDVDPLIAAVGPLTYKCDSWQSSDKQRFVELPNIEGKTPAQVSKLLTKKFKGQFRMVHMLAFFCTMFDNAAFKDIGYLPTAYDKGLGDDDETCYTLRKKGRKLLFTPETLCFHHHRTTFKTLFTEDEIKEVKVKNMKILRERCPGVY